MNKSDIIERIRKLFALGDKNRNPNEGEVKTALAMASKLMKEHNLTLTEVDLEKQKEEIIQEQTLKGKSISFWERKLAGMIAQLFDCQALIHTNYEGRGWNFVGFEQEAKLAAQCYVYLNNVIRIMANTYAVHKMDFYAGITDKLWERVEEEVKLRTTQESSKCTAIVCCKDKLIKSWEDKNLNITTESRRAPRIDIVSPDYRRGYLAGENIDLQNKPKIKNE